MMNKGANYNNRIEIRLKKHAICFQKCEEPFFVLMVSCHLLSVGAAYLTYLSDIHHTIAFWRAFVSNLN